MNNNYLQNTNKYIQEHKKYNRFTKKLPFSTVSGSVYGKTIRRTIDKDAKSIIGLKIKSYPVFLAVGPLSTSPQHYCFIYRRVYIRQISSNTLIYDARPEYLANRVISAKSKDYYSYYEAGSYQNGEVSTPIITFLGQNENSYIPIENLSDLEVVCEINDGFLNMGFDLDISSFSADLFIDYVNDYGITEIPKQINQPYIQYYEPSILLTNTTANATGTIRFPLICPYPCINVSFLIKTETDIFRGRIESFKLEIGNTKIDECDKELNYNRYDSENYYEQDGTYTRWFVKKKSRIITDDNYGAYTFGSTSRDTYGTIVYKLPKAENYRLYIFEDCVANFMIEKDEILENDTNAGSLLYRSYRTLKLG